MKIKQVAIAFDQLVNTLLGGYADETMSSRCWRLRQGQPYKVLRPIVDTIFFWEPNHCQASYESEIRRTQEPQELR